MFAFNCVGLKSRMRIRLCFFLLFAVPALATPSNSNCIAGCNCKNFTDERKLKIFNCASPLVLTRNALADVSKKTATIAFKNVVITSIEEDAFDGFNDLGIMIFEDAQIDSIKPSALELKQLTTISFTKINFGGIPHLKSEYLEELIFNDCKLTNVPNLEELPALGFLNLANNQIKNIDEMTFARAEGFEELTLSNNSIVELPLNLFVNNLDFNTLNLDYNPLKSFQLNLSSDLELLSLRFCNLSVFDRTSTETLNSVSYLDLSGNEISVLPFDVFENMKDLNYLDLSNNKLVELDDNIFWENSKLDKITLDNNQLEYLPNFQTKNTLDSTYHVFQTYHFSCKNCGLKSLKNGFENMPGLVTIDLSENEISDIEGIFTEMYGLKNLNLSHNSITTLGANSFGRNAELIVLDLSHNPLKPLDPVAFANIESLKELHVSSSGLLRLWANQNAVLPSLENLYVDNNKITVFSVADLEVTPNLKLLDVRDNPLGCTEGLHRFLQFVLTKQIRSSESRKTHEALMSETVDSNSSLNKDWRNLATSCNMNSVFEDEDEDDDNSENEITKEPGIKYFDDNIINDDEFYASDDDESDSKDDEDELYLVNARILDERNRSTFDQASYILSITSVFIVTALVVLILAVGIILLILKRNKSLNMYNGNLPTLKIPLWHTTPGQKRHSGSVYKPLSEDFSGPKTPIINRYEFKQTPQVHIP